MEIKKRHLRLVKPRKKAEEKKTRREITIARLLNHAKKLKW